MSTKENVLQFLRNHPGVYTATFIATTINAKLSSISSLLKKLTQQNLIQRHKNVGPRGGYGYEIKK